MNAKKAIALFVVIAAALRTKSDCRGYNIQTSVKDLEEVECTHYCYGTDLIAKDGTKDCHGFDLRSVPFV